MRDKATEPTEPYSYQAYSYQAVFAASERVSWRIEDVIGGDKRLDFARPFLPETLARVEPLEFLTAAEKRIFNQIRGHAYLNIFGLVEEFILPFVLDHARARIGDDSDRVRALLQFAVEEAKHIDLFKRFRGAFQRGFGSACAVIGPADEVGREVLSHHPLAVALVILHIEWMTQRHYVDSVRDNQGLDPQFKSLLRHHWIEEAQHAKLDTLMVHALAEACGDDEIDRALDGYVEIGGFIDAGLRQQTEFDLEALAVATGRMFDDDERRAFIDVQHQANRWTYLGSGMTHDRFLGTVEAIRPGAGQRFEAMAPAFC
jgi:hypothetical protein